MALPCPICGGYLKYDAVVGRYYCPRCGWKEYALEVPVRDEEDDD